MPFLVLIFYAVPIYFAIRRTRFWRRMGEARHAAKIQKAASLATGLLVLLAMGTQMYLLWKMGLFGVATALPLHLCSFMGIVTPIMLLTKSRGLLEFTLYLGVPGAMAALIFPAVLPSPWPFVMNSAFFSLHALIVLAPFLRMADGSRPRDGALGRVFLWGNMLLLFVMLVNGLLNTNYFFLRAAPTGTPLRILQNMGQAAYIAALELAALVLLKMETMVFKRIVHKALF